MRRFWNLFFSLLAIGLIVLCVQVTRQQGFHFLFGGKPLAAGQALFQFDPLEVKIIELKMRGQSARFEPRSNGVWWGVKPWQDRVDPRGVGALLQFSKGTEIFDVLNPKDLESKEKQFGLRKEAVSICFKRQNGEQLVDYQMGYATPWVWTNPNDPKIKEQTVYAQTDFYDRRKEVFVLTGNIRPLFDPTFRHLRDHRPFLFHRSQPEEVRISHKNSEITLQRPSPEQPWRIVSPIELPADPARSAMLLNSLEKLTALQVEDFDPAKAPTQAEKFEISIKRFDNPEFTKLSIYTQADEKGRTVAATISDRPNALFYLPLKREDNLIGLSEIPFSLSQLRSKSLVELDRVKLRSIKIQTPTDPIGLHINRLSQAPTDRYRLVDFDEKPSPVNEAKLASFLEALGIDPVANFTSDAALDLAHYRLDQPETVIKIDYFDDLPSQLILISTGLDGKKYSTVQGSNRVVELSPDAYAKLASQPHQWRDSRLFAFDSMDIRALNIISPTGDPLELQYQFESAEWKARQGNRDLSLDLNTNRANFLLNRLVGLQVSRWLPSDHPGLNESLTSPLITFELVHQVVDQFGDSTGTQKKRIVFAAPNGAKKPLFYYGFVEGDSNGFSIDAQTLRELTTPLIDEATP